MEVRTTLKLIIEKGPREGEILTYSSPSLIKVGRVARGNTIGIKDPGISSKHMCIQFDTQISKWTLSDLDSSNGTVLNGQILKPYVPSALNDGDQVKIGELTSIVVKIEAESVVRPRRNVRRQGKCEPEPETEVESDAVGVEIGKSELGLGFDGELGKIEVKEPVKKRNLRKKGVDSRNEVESLSSRRILRSAKKEEVSFVPRLNEIPENLNVGVTEIVDVCVPVEPKKRGRKKKTVEQVAVGPDLDERKAANAVVVPVVGRVTRGRRKGLAAESLDNVQSGGLEKNLNNANESLQVDEGNEATCDKVSVDRLEKVKDSGLGENLDANNESAREHVVEKLVSDQECSDGNDVMADESLGKGKGVAEESECVKDGCGNERWLDLEKMTLGDFFDYMKVQLSKEIYDKSEEIISDLKEKARKCHEFRLQKNESGKGKVVTD